MVVHDLAANFLGVTLPELPEPYIVISTDSKTVHQYSSRLHNLILVLLEAPEPFASTP
jgi:hypothetical protein